MPLLAGLLTLAALGWGCAAETTVRLGVQKQQVQLGPWTRPCGDLPASRPEDFVLRYAIHRYDDPQKLIRIDVIERGRPCPPDELPGHLLRTYYQPRTCLEVPAPEMDRLYGVLHTHRVDTIRTRRLPLHPHRGGTVIGLSFNGQRCEVADITNESEIAPEDRERYRAAVKAIHAAIRAHQ